MGPAPRRLSGIRVTRPFLSRCGVEGMPSGAPLAASHTWAVLSSEAVITRMPSGLNTALLTLPLWLVRLVTPGEGREDTRARGHPGGRRGGARGDRAVRAGAAADHGARPGERAGRWWRS